MTVNILVLQPLIAFIAGLLILLIPRLLSRAVARSPALTFDWVEPADGLTLAAAAFARTRVRR